jgi:hypothetical protein
MSVSTAVASLRDDLRKVFGIRLRSLVLYGTHVETYAATGGSEKTTQPVHTLALVEDVRFTDLQACASMAAAWRQKGLGIPLLLGSAEFARSLDAFPLEYGDIILRHVVIEGDDPFRNVAIQREDVRRACEVQAKSHLIHLREGYLETGGNAARVRQLIAASAPPFRSLLVNVARLHDVMDTLTPDAIVADCEQSARLDPEIVRRIITMRTVDDLPAAEALTLYPRYLAVVEQLVAYVDAWRA